MEGDGGGWVREGVGGQNNGLQRVWGWNPASVGAGERHRVGTRVQARKVRVGEKMSGVFGLKQDNVATFECNVATFQRGKQPTPRRSRKGKNRRRDVEIQRRDVLERCKINVATLRSNVATLRSNVATFQRMENQRHDVESQRHDIPEKTQNEKYSTMV